MPSSRVPRAGFRAGAARLLALGSVLAPLGACRPPVVQVDPTERHQVMVGWEAGAQSGQDVVEAEWIGPILDVAVDVIGVNGVRVGVRSGSEKPTDDFTRFLGIGGLESEAWRCSRYATVNDDDDPFTIDWDGFHFSELDRIVERVVLPMSERLSARGEHLRVTLTYVAFTDQICDDRVYFHADQPEEYAEFVLAAFEHLSSEYGLVPDAWELVLEPDLTGSWTGEQVGRALVATATRLRAAGFDPEFTGPTGSNVPATLAYMDAMARVDGAPELLDELSYHRYAETTTPEELSALAGMGARYGIRTAMMEHITGNVDELHDDLTYGNVSSWVQAVIAYPSRDSGAHLIRYTASEGRASVPEVTSRARLLTQYFRYVRAGARRIGAASSSARVAPVAFQEPDGAVVVVARAHDGRRFVVRGLPPDRYRVTFTNEEDFLAEGGEYDVSADGELSLRVPGGGVATVFPASGG